MNWIELIGYMGSALVAVSLLMSNIWRLRWINMMGAITFFLYGILLHSLPVVVMNFFIFGIDLFFIIQMIRQKDYFNLLPLAHADNAFLLYFLRYYHHDITKYYPDFQIDVQATGFRIFILRNMLPVGLFIYRIKDNAAHVRLDYVIPAYRDLKNAHHFYEYGVRYLKKQHISRICTKSYGRKHSQYLLKVGFKPDPENPSSYLMTI